MTVKWENYVVPALDMATTKDVAAMEGLLGIKFPEDYKALILENQGKCPDKEMVESDEINPVPFGPLFHIQTECDKSHELYGVAKRWEKWNKIYEKKVPIADSAGSGAFFAYDYNVSADNPPIVFIDTGLAPDDEDAVLLVASSINELVSNLK